MDSDELEDLFEDLNLDGPTQDQLFTIYGIFLNDFARKPLVVNGVNVSFNNTKSRQPVCPGKALTFEHIITRGSKYNNRRSFDPERANKIHWIRPIIENLGNPRIKYFERINGEGFNQKFFWFPEQAFIVILRVITQDCILITAFSVAYGEKGMYKTWYEEFRDR